jgi:hypothetical protein
MGSRRLVLFRPAARVGLIASSLALLATLLSPNPTLAASTLGTTGDPIDVVCSFPSQDSIQLSSGTPTISYTVPAAGTIASWNTQSIGLPGKVGLQVWRLSAAATANTPAVYMLVGASPTVVPTGTAINLAPQIAVQAGDMIGMRMEGLVACGHRTGAPGDTWTSAFGTIPSLPALGTEAFSAPTSMFRLNISATMGSATTPPPSTCDNPSGSSTGNEECDQNSSEQADKEKADKSQNAEGSPAQTSESNDSGKTNPLALAAARHDADGAGGQAQTSHASPAGNGSQRFEFLRRAI